MQLEFLLQYDEIKWAQKARETWLLQGEHDSK